MSNEILEFTSRDGGKVIIDFVREKFLIIYKSIIVIKPLEEAKRLFNFSFVRQFGTAFLNNNMQINADKLNSEGNFELTADFLKLKFYPNVFTQIYTVLGMKISVL